MIQFIVFISLLPATAVKDFTSEWIKYRFGAFDEHGYTDDPVNPLFFKNAGDVYPTSCTNEPIRGNFTAECLTQPASCPFEEGQSGITSSLLYDTDTNVFPEARNKQYSYVMHALHT